MTFWNVSHERLFWIPWLRRCFWRADKERCFGHSNNACMIAFQTLPSSRIVSPRPSAAPDIRHRCDSIFWQNRHFRWLWRRLKLSDQMADLLKNTDIGCCSDVCTVSFLRDLGVRIAIILTIFKKMKKNKLTVLRTSYRFQHRSIFWMGYHAILSVKSS